MSLLRYRSVMNQLPAQRLSSTWTMSRTYPMDAISHLQRWSLSRNAKLRRQQQSPSSSKADDAETLARAHEGQKLLSLLSSIDPSCCCCCQCRRATAAAGGGDCVEKCGSHSTVDDDSIVVEPSLKNGAGDCEDKQDGKEEEAAGGGAGGGGGGGIGGGHRGCMKELWFLLEITEIVQGIRHCVLQRSADRIDRTSKQAEEAIVRRFYANEIKSKNLLEAVARNAELVTRVQAARKEIEAGRGAVQREEEAAVLAECGLSAAEYAQLGVFRHERNIRAHPAVGSLETARVLGLWRTMQKKAGGRGRGRGRGSQQP